MDSLTQITLGAAVGELVLGKKVGNRAMLWGAIGGTMPDLDVIGNFTTDQLGALAYHRSISHSFAFAVVAPLALGWVVHHVYRTENRKKWGLDMAVAWALIAVLMIVGALVLPIPREEAVVTGLVVSVVMMGPALGAGLWRWKYRTAGRNASWQEWSWLLFWAIITHPLLDCCTTYGTQIFQPFSDYRAAIDNISVVDPLYTLPFLIFVLLTARQTRGSSRRRLVSYLGIGISSAYMLFTFYNKYRVDRLFADSLQEQGLRYERLMTSPTILNNILWQGVAESDSVFYYGLYSFFDKDRRIDFQAIPKNHHLLAGQEDERAVKILAWFSDGYYSIDSLPGGQLQFNDLRFGEIRRSANEAENFVFKFVLQPRGDTLEAFQNEASRRDLNGAFDYLLERAKGE